MPNPTPDPTPALAPEPNIIAQNLISFFLLLQRKDKEYTTLQEWVNSDLPDEQKFPALRAFCEKCPTVYFAVQAGLQGIGSSYNLKDFEPLIIHLENIHSSLSYIASKLPVNENSEFNGERSASDICPRSEGVKNLIDCVAISNP